jgi:4-hydroxy-tetrahydrodipicolinate synthase
MESAVRANIEYLRCSGAHGLMVLGSTGEFPLFGAEERVALLHQITEWAAPLPVLANISDIRPRVVARLAQAAREAGCASVAILPPWYFPLNQADLLEFFLRAAEAAAPLPVFLYNFPERVGNPIQVDTIAAFASRAPLAGVKLSGGAWELHAEVVQLGREKSFSVLTGWDTRLADAMALGCSGCISGFANFAAESIVATYRAVEAGNPGAAVESTRQLREAAAALQGLLFPQDVTAGMLARGFEMGEPKQAVAASTLEARDAVVGRLRDLFRSFGWK